MLTELHMIMPVQGRGKMPSHCIFAYMLYSLSLACPCIPKICAVSHKRQLTLSNAADIPAESQCIQIHLQCNLYIMQ